MNVLHSYLMLSCLDRSVMQLMGAPPVSAAAAKNLPLPDMISSPRAAVVLALAGYDARGMPGLQGLLRGENTVRVKDDYPDGAYLFTLLPFRPPPPPTPRDLRIMLVSICK